MGKCINYSYVDGFRKGCERYEGRWILSLLFPVMRARALENENEREREREREKRGIHARAAVRGWPNFTSFVGWPLTVWPFPRRVPGQGVRVRSRAPAGDPPFEGQRGTSDTCTASIRATETRRGRRETMRLRERVHRIRRRGANVGK